MRPEAAPNKAHAGTKRACTAMSVCVCVYIQIHMHTYVYHVHVYIHIHAAPNNFLYLFRVQFEEEIKGIY